MKIRIKKIAPLQAGKMLAALYACGAVIAVPFLLIAALVGPKGHGGVPVAMALGLPLIYIVGGFIGGVIGSFIYNLVAGWIGGMEIDIQEERI